MATFGTEKGLARFSSVSREITNWVVLVPMSIPTESRVSAITPAPSTGPSRPPPRRSGGWWGRRDPPGRRRSARPGRRGAVCSPPPQAVSRSGSLSWERSRFHPAARARGLGARPHNRASWPYLAAASLTAALKRSTWGKIRALSRPWGTWNFPPNAWARLWHRPSPAALKAMPAKLEARSICRLARLSPWLSQAGRRFSQARVKAFSAKASE